jgi:hypothetical protein
MIIMHDQCCMHEFQLTFAHTRLLVIHSSSAWSMQQRHEQLGAVATVARFRRSHSGCQMRRAH